jgi:hypothetical protein
MTKTFELRASLNGYDDDTTKLEVIGFFPTNEKALEHIGKLVLSGELVRSAEITEREVDLDNEVFLLRPLFENAKY